jgi:aldehyde dehydrogenase (NAD+)
LSPLGAAIAGGNIVVSVVSSRSTGLPEVSVPTKFKLDVKAKATYELLCKLSKGAIDTTAYPILLGSASVVEQTASASFTSYHATSTDVTVRKRIQSMAAANSGSLTLLPDTLGHNVCIVNKTISQQDLGSVAEQVCRSNYGCVGGQGLGATSLVLVHEAIHDLFAKEMVKATRQLFPRSGNGWKDVAKYQATSGEYEALNQSLDGHSVICGGEFDRSVGAFAPTVVEGVKPDSALLARSRGSPVIPLVPFTSTETAIAVAQER